MGREKKDSEKAALTKLILATAILNLIEALVELINHLLR